ncbi:Deoxycytidylate deaminase [Chlorella vulgaris]
MLTHDSSANRLLIVAAASAAASSLLTYSVIRWRSRTFQHAHASRASLVEPSNGDFDATLADPYDPSPRAGHLVWDDYFMAVAFLSAQRSKDPNKQVGACIVDRNNIICGIGYNGFPRGCPDSRLPWAKKSASGNPLETKYPYVCHAEMNAILNKNGASVEGAKVFVTMFPCNECAKLMIQAGISEIVYHEAKDQPAQSDSPLITSSFK